MYGTPVFTTVGGKSKCPGETGTSMRDSGVTMQVIPRCCKIHPTDCNCNNLPAGSTANFGVVVQNMSPTCKPFAFYCDKYPFNLWYLVSVDDTVYYTLMYDNAFDAYVSASTVGSTYATSCGATNHKAGLSMGYLDPMSEGVSSIPFGVRTEIPVTFTTNGYCNTFNNVNLMLIASCEIPTPNSRVQQYATVPNTVPVQINYNNYTYAQNWTVPFSVSWAASRRLSEEEEEATGE